MTTVRTLAALCGLVAALQLNTAVAFAADRVVHPDRQLCAKAAAAAEASFRLPANLLKAMTAVESGYWPWAVRARGKAFMMPTHDAAVDLVRQLRSEGVKDIMVGCLQIHLRYHPEAFDSIEEALEPSANAAYAGEYLKSLVDDASWWDAVGRYQGGKPSARRAYVEKVATVLQAGAPIPTGRKKAKSEGVAKKAAAPRIEIADAPFDPDIEGVIDMTPFTNLTFGGAGILLARLSGPDVF